MEISSTINEVNELKRTLDKLSPIGSKNKERLWRKFRLEFNYNSNHIEGNTLDYGQTKLLLIFGKTDGTNKMRELEEMKAHDVALNLIRGWSEDESRELTEKDIRDLNGILLVEPFYKEAITPDGTETQRRIEGGVYKKHPNHVVLANGEIFHYTSPQDVPIEMEKLINWYRNESPKEHALIVASLLHYRFVRIHPFDDGNGRVSRLLMNYELMKKGFPPVIIKSSDKKNYLDALNKADSGNINAFVEYIGKQLIWTLELNIKAAKGESIEEDDDLDKELEIWQKQYSQLQEGIALRSDDYIYQRYEDSIKPLFEDFIEKIKKVEKLFDTTLIRGWVNNGNSDHRGVEHIDDEFERWASQQATFLNPGEAPEPVQKDQFKSIALNVEFKGFKYNGINVFDLYKKIYIDFQDYYKYSIKWENKVLFEELYSKTLTHDKKFELVKTMVKDIMKEVNQKTNRE